MATKSKIGKPTDEAREAAIRRLRYELQLPAESIAKLRAALSSEEQPTDSTAGMVRDALLADALLADALLADALLADALLADGDHHQVVPVDKNSRPQPKSSALEKVEARAPPMRTNREMGLPPSWSEKVGFDVRASNRGLSWIERLNTEVAAAEAEREAAENRDVWEAPLKRLCGVIDPDGAERITSMAVFDVLGVPENNRTTAAGRRLAAIMRSLGWSQVKMHAMTRAGYRERIRGFCRAMTTKQAQGYARDARHVRVATE